MAACCGSALFLTHAGSIVDSAKMFDMSKSSAWRYIDQIMNVLLLLGKKFIRLPDTLEEWKLQSDGFEKICAFPNVCLSIDGVLFEIERPFHYEGWYCRKGFPAINALVAVDPLKRNP